jgi:hypothetical protein
VLWVNDAQREVALLKPDASAKNETVTLDAGTKQSIPNSGNRLLRVVRNMSAASGGNGLRAIRIVDREVLDAMSPDWHDPSVANDAAHGSSVKHYIYDDQNPRNFYVYPGVVGSSSHVEIIYSANPTGVTKTDAISIPDIYANCLMNYVLYMCYMKDSEHAGSQQRAQSHFNIFQTSVTGKSQVDTTTTPNTNMERGADGGHPSHGRRQ